MGVSTASRVISGDPTVSTRPETRARILATANQLGYRPNAFARGLRTSRTMTLGVIAHLPYYHEIADILVAVERAAGTAGYVTLIADTADFIDRGDAYHRLLTERRVDGLLIASILVSDSFVRDVSDEGLPFVVLNRRIPGGRGLSASVEDAEGVACAVEHLASLGHTRIAYLAGTPTAEPVERRLKGFRAGMHAVGLRVSRRLVKECGVDDQAVYEATRELLDEPSRPTALIVWSPTAAVPALAAARQSGLKLPEELSVVSYNDSTLAAYLEPPLTTVRMSLDEMACLGVECLLRQIDGDPVESIVVHTPPTLIARGSSVAAPQR